jgi:hypothetical protein
MHSDLAEEAQGICLVATFLVRTGERQRLLGKDMRLFSNSRLGSESSM